MKINYLLGILLMGVVLVGCNKEVAEEQVTPTQQEVSTTEVEEVEKVIVVEEVASTDSY